MKTAGVVVGVVVVILVGLGITTIWRDSPGPEPTTAEAWTTNMSQLGIRPVYPPSEDLHVGDLWAVAVEANPAPGTRPVTPLLSQGVRIGHVPLREAIIAASHRRPVFAARSIEPGSPQHAPWMEISEMPQAERIGLAEVGFPSVVRRRTLRASGSGSYLLASLRGGADETIVEEISVPQAVGYGTDSAVAAIALARWCGEQAGLCNQTTLRRILRFALGGAVAQIR